MAPKLYNRCYTDTHFYKEAPAFGCHNVFNRKLQISHLLPPTGENTSFCLGVKFSYFRDTYTPVVERDHHQSVLLNTHLYMLYIKDRQSDPL